MGYTLQFLCVTPKAVGRSSSGCVTIRYALPVLLTTSCFRRMNQVEACRYRCRDAAAAFAQANAPAAWCQLRPVLDGDGRRVQTSSSCKGCWGRSLRCIIALFTFEIQVHFSATVGASRFIACSRHERNRNFHFPTLPRWSR